MACRDALLNDQPSIRSNVLEALELAWGSDTSNSAPEWTPMNRAFGQCAVTALVIQDIFGGEVVRSEAILPDGTVIPHYKNLIRNQEVDYTSSQFPIGTQISKGVENKKQFGSTRDYVLSSPDTRDRYETLKRRFSAALENQSVLSYQRTVFPN